MKIATRKIINDTRCSDALDDLLCSIRKVSRPDEEQEQAPLKAEAVVGHHHKESEVMYGNTLQFMAHASIPRILLDLFTFGAFSQYLYR